MKIKPMHKSKDLAFPLIMAFDKEIVLLHTLQWKFHHVVLRIPVCVEALSDILISKGLSYKVIYMLCRE